MPNNWHDNLSSHGSLPPSAGSGVVGGSAFPVPIPIHSGGDTNLVVRVHVETPDVSGGGGGGGAFGLHPSVGGNCEGGSNHNLTINV